MCEEAKNLIVEYLNAEEHYDRICRISLAACRSHPEALEGYRSLTQEAKMNLEYGRARFRSHQQAHSCSEAMRFADDFSLCGIYGHGLAEVSQLHNQGCSL